MKGGTLFSGIGAPELAAPDIDWRWCGEVDPFASAVLAARFPHSANLGDVTKVNWDAVESVDIVVFGSPCQSFSVAGQRAGLDDPRGNLALVGLRAVSRVQPRWMVFENVPGLLSSGEGRDFGAFLGSLGQCGYGFAYRVLDAQHFGVPQRRRRVFVVGCLGDWRGAAAVLFERESLSWDTAPRRAEREGIAAKSLCSTDGGIDREDRHTLIAGCLQERDYKGSDSDTKPGHLIVVPPLMARQHRNGRDQTLSTGFTTDGHIVTHSLRADGFDASEDGTGRGTPLIPVQCNGTNVGFDLPSLRAGNQHITGGGPAIAFDPGRIADPLHRENLEPGGPCQTLGSADRVPAIASAMSVRRLTPVECARLQAFPDDFLDIEYRGKPAADGNKYRALGNAMCVSVIGWILERVRAIEL